MNRTSNHPTPGNFWKWFDPRRRQVGTWGFALNRITALGLTFYLYLHLIVLGKLAQGPDAYDGFLATLHHPVFIFGEWLVVIAGLIHGLNGVRVALTSFGVGVSKQRAVLVALLVISVIGGLIFAVRMFTA
jgi:succinate dehydrogenase / fumarate reductase cytochrome b subunit